MRFRALPPFALAAALAAVMLVGATGCGGGGAPSTAEGVSATQRPPTKGPEGGPGTEERLNTIAGLIAGQPLLAGDFADPFVLDLGEAAYIYATNTTDANIPVVRSNNYTEAFYLGDAMPDLPSWTAKRFIWAPTVWARPDGSYVMYYAGLNSAAGRMCVSRAVSSSPAGPFTDDSSEPFICPLDQGGAIDPAIVDVNGSPYLLYKNDGNCCGITTTLWSVPLSADGLSVAGTPTALLSDDQGWEGGNTEAPSMVAVGDKYLLFYSANNWATENYAIGYGVCDSVSGPCRKPDGDAWMTSTAEARGPGGQEFFEADGQVWMVYHGWLPGQVDTPGGQRRLFLDVITVNDDVPERIGAERTFVQVLWWFAGVVAVIVVVVVAVVTFVRRRRRATAATG